MLRLIIASVVWAFSFGLIKHTLVSVGLDPNLIAFVRLGTSLLMFLPFLRLKKIGESVRYQLVGVGMLQYGVMYVAYLSAYRYLAAHEVAIFTIFTPIFVALLGGAPTRRRQMVFMLSALLAVAGAAVIVWSTRELHVRLTGFLLVQVSNLAFAFGQVRYRAIMKSHEHVHNHEVFALLYLGGTVFAALPCMITTDWHGISLSGAQLGTLLYLGVVPSGLCFYLWNAGARQVNSGTLAVLNNAKIPLAVAVSLLVFHEHADLQRLLIGGVVILLSALLAERHARRMEANGVAPTAPS